MVGQGEIDEQRRRELLEFFARFGIKPERLELIELALTHTSYAFENNLEGDNERLEFLGDAVLGFLVSQHLYTTHRQITEGELSKLKSQLVSRSVLGRVAFELGIGRLIRVGRGEEQTGGRRRLSLLGSALEALIGAVYLDLGLDAAHKFITPFLLNVEDTITQQEAFQDYKSRLQETVQRLFSCVPRYETIHAEGPDHDKTFYVSVYVGDELMGYGQGRRIKSAENRAARAALQKLSSDRKNTARGASPPESLK